LGNQFKKPLANMGGKPPQASLSTSVPEQNTLIRPAVRMPPLPNTPPDTMPHQRHAQSHPGQDDFHPGGMGQFGETPMNQPFGGQAGNQALGQPFSGQPGSRTMDQLFDEQPGMRPTRRPFGGQPTDQSANSLFGAAPMLPLGGPGTSMSSQQMAAMGGIGTPDAAWSNRFPISGQREKPASVRDRERSQGEGKRGKKRRRVPIWARVVIGFLSLLIMLVAGGFTYYQLTYAPVLNSVTGKQFTRVQGEEDPNQGKSGSVLNWGRINILLLGSDTDEKPAWGGNSFLAQTVIVVSVDTRTHDVDMLSIPRDYYIRIPGYGLDKLDTAFSHGGSTNNNMSGVGLVEDTLDQDFGIKINFYAWVGLQGFIKVIDTVHGVDVNVMHPVVDDTYPDDVGTKGAAQSNYKRVYIPDGAQHLDGPTALEYVRSRHSTNDFDRSARQQQVLGALKLKLANTGIIGELPQIAKDLQGSLATQLNTSQLLDLGNFARGIQPDEIKHLTLGGSKYSTSGQIKTSYGIEDVVYPRCDSVPQAINSFLHITTAVCKTTLGPGQQAPPLASSPGAGTGTSGFAPMSTLASASTLSGADFSLGQSMSSFSDLFGLRDLIDLMSMVVLDSPQV
jgi:LCP family protein required for cell wall assembly